MNIAEKTSVRISIKELPPMRVASCRVISSSPERDAATYLRDLMIMRNIPFDDLRKFGIEIPVSENDHRLGLRCYEYWVCLPDKIKSLVGTTQKKIPRRIYAVLRIELPDENPFNAIATGWFDLHDWIGESEYEPAIHDPNRYMMEEQIEIDNITYMDLYYPVSFYDYAD